MPIARWNGEVIASSSVTHIVEGNHYFPMSSVRQRYLLPSATSSYSPWKGTASYYTLRVAGEDNPDAAWCYAQPKDKAVHIKDHVAFGRGVEIAD